MKKHKLAILIAQPVHYDAPLFKKLANNPEMDLTVYYCFDARTFGSNDPDFGRPFRLDPAFLEGYEYKFLKNLSNSPRVSRFWDLFNPGIVGEIFRNKYDAIIIHGYSQATHWLAILAALSSGTPFFLRGETPYNQEKFKSSTRLFIKKLFLGPLFLLAAGFLYIGEENKKFYKSYGVPDKKLFFAPYAVDNDLFREKHKQATKNREETRRALGIQPGEVVIIFSGKFIAKKRPMDILRAYNLIEESNKSLLFAGAGLLEEEMKNYVLEKNINNVHFAGLREQGEMPGLYASADIFVLPSGPGETWGMVVNEAMSAELPIVISDIVGCGVDLVRDGENGFIVPMGDVATLAKKLFWLVENGGERAKFGRRSGEIIQEYSYTRDEVGVLKALSHICRRAC